MSLKAPILCNVLLSLILAAFAGCKVPESTDTATTEQQPESGTSASNQQFESDTRGPFVLAEQQEYLSFVYFKDPDQQLDRLLKRDLISYR